MVFVSDGILVPNIYASRTISFANKFPQMDLLGPLIRSMYSSGHLIDDVPADLSRVLQHDATLAPLLFLALWYCTGVLPVVGHTCFLCSGIGGVFLVYFFLVASDDGVVWIGLGGFCSLLLDSSSGSTPGGGDV